MQRFVNYIKASYAELRKVNWPTRSQAIRLTGVVVIFAGVLSLYITVLDTIFKSLLQKLILKS